MKSPQRNEMKQGLVMESQTSLYASLSLSLQKKYLTKSLTGFLLILITTSPLLK